MILKKGNPPSLKIFDTFYQKTLPGPQRQKRYREILSVREDYHEKRVSAKSFTTQTQQ